MPDMDLDFIEKLIGVVSRSPIGELAIERDGMRVRIAKQSKSAATAQSLEPSLPAPVDSATAVAPAATAARHSIRAPLTGIFYRADAEGDPPLVTIGDVIEEGQKIGILEAMKTFNVMEADRAGKIVEIAFEDRSSVQAGDVLFTLEEVG
jgi:acetyl-CoA carboxylase biotin carboxyl carrier protein